MEKFLQCSIPSINLDHNNLPSFSNDGIEEDAKLRNQILKESFDTRSKSEFINFVNVYFHCPKRIISSSLERF